MEEKEKGEKKSKLLFDFILATWFFSDILHLSPVLAKRSVILLHGLDLRVLVSIFFLFHWRFHTRFSFIAAPHNEFSTHQTFICTWIFAAFVPLDEAHDEKHEDEESDGAHQADEPALRGDVDLTIGNRWEETAETSVQI